MREGHEQDRINRVHRQGQAAAADPLHHRQRGLRALQLLRDAQHPDAVPVSGVLLSYAAPRASASGAAKDVFHIFVIGVYFFPLLGGWLADRFFGKYRTILCSQPGLLRRPRVPRAVRGQPHRLLHRPVPDRARLRRHQAAASRRSWATSSTRRNKRLAKIVFDAFYWIINFGSFFASLLMPFPARTTGRRRLRHPGRADVDRHRDLLARPPALRARAAGAAGPGFVPARRAHCALGAAPAQGPAGACAGRDAVLVLALAFARLDLVRSSATS